MLFETLRFLGGVKDAPKRIDISFAESLVRYLRDLEPFVNRQLVFSLDLVASGSKEWYIAASTDPARPVLRRFTFDDGLTGWALKTHRRSPLYIPDRKSMPVGIRPTPTYENVESAFIYLLKTEQEPTGCICVVSNSPQAISRELADELRKLGNILEILFGSKQWVVRSGRRDPQAHLPAVADEENILDWLFRRMDSLPYDSVNFWTWSPATSRLLPKQVSAPLRQLGTNWLRHLSLGEGFVGTCAQAMKPIIESDIDNGLGVDTGIFTPLSEIRPDLPLRSVIAYPVGDEYKLYGVLAILGETAHQFGDDDLSIAKDVAAELSLLYGQLESLRLSDLQRKIRDDLLGALSEPDTPSKYWKRLGKVLGMIEEKRLGVVSYFFVAKRDSPTWFSCKAVSPAASASLGLVFDSASHALFRLLRRAPPGLYSIEKIRGTDTHKDLINLGVTHLWVDSYYFFDKSQTPNLITVVALPPKSPHSSLYGNRDIGLALDQIFSSAFAITRAVFATADAQRLSRERERLLAAETHVIRQPLTALRHEAEALANLSGQNADRRNQIIAKVDDLLLRIDNILYSNWYTKKTAGEKVERKKPIDVLDFMREIVAKSIQPDAADLFTIDDSELSADIRYVVHGFQRWLHVAFMNILHNAIKFGRNTPVQIKFQTVSDESKNYIRVSIKDRGIGIPPEELKDIFTRGHQNKYSRRFVVTGSQIGLSITKEIINEHGGEVWAKSQVGEYATFNVQLPVELKDMDNENIVGRR